MFCGYLEKNVNLYIQFLFVDVFVIMAQQKIKQITKTKKTTHSRDIFVKCYIMKNKAISNPIFNLILNKFNKHLINFNNLINI